jgi:hypothetical protein
VSLRRGPVGFGYTVAGVEDSEPDVRRSDAFLEAHSFRLDLFLWSYWLVVTSGLFHSLALLAVALSGLVRHFHRSHLGPWSGCHGRPS